LPEKPLIIAYYLINHKLANKQVKKSVVVMESRQILKESG